MQRREGCAYTSMHADDLGRGADFPIYRTSCVITIEVLVYIQKCVSFVEEIDMSS